MKQPAILAGVAIGLLSAVAGRAGAQQSAAATVAGSGGQLATAQSLGASAAVPTGEQADSGVDTGARLQEVVVTAARFSQNLQKVSASVSVVSGSDITNQGLANVADIIAELPNVQALGVPGGFAVTIRGMGADTPPGSTQGPVPLEFDGIYNVNAQGTVVGFFDVNHVEVLRGPQSTRYGPDADGGLVNVITNDPVLNSDAGYGAVTVGDYGLFRTEFAQNIPLTDQLAGRIAVATINRNSYFTPAEGNAVAQSIRAKLLYRPSDSLSLKLEYQLDHIGGTGLGSNVFPILTARVPPYAFGSINDHGNPWENGDIPSNGVGSGQDKADLYQQTAVLDVDSSLNSWLAADLLTSYSNMHGGEDACTDFPPSGTNWGPWTTGLPGNCFDIHEFSPFYQYTSELRFHNTEGERLIWDLGLYHWNYFWASWWPFQGIPGPAGGPSYATETNAIYGELTYPVTDRLRLIAGARESFDRRKQNFGPNGTALTPTLSLNLNHFDYRAGAEYDLTPRSMEYLTVATGYRPGGLNEYLPEVQVATKFGDEVNTAFEVGTKNMLLDRRLEFNMDVFYYVQKGIQDPDKYASNATTVVINGQTITCNETTLNYYAACQTPEFGLSGKEWGIESQIVYNLTSNDRLSLSPTVLNAHYDKNQPGPCAVLGAPSTPGCWDGYNPEAGPLEGQTVFFNIGGMVEAHSPRFSGDVQYDHLFRFQSGAQLTVGVDGFYTSGYYTNPVEDEYAWQPAYWQEGATAAYLFPSGDWKLSAYGHNLSNYAVKESVLPATTIGPPRTVGLVISKEW